MRINGKDKYPLIVPMPGYITYGEDVYEYIVIAKEAIDIVN